MGILRAAYEHGIRVPQDISLLGFDNVASSELPCIRLTNVAQTEYDIGAFAVTRMLERLVGGEQRIRI